MSDEACVTTTTTAWSRVARAGRVERAAKGATGRRVWLTLHLSTGSNCVDAAKRCDAMRCDVMRERQRQPHNNNNCRLTSQMERGKRDREGVEGDASITRDDTLTWPSGLLAMKQLAARQQLPMRRARNHTHLSVAPATPTAETATAETATATARANCSSCEKHR